MTVTVEDREEDWQGHRAKPWEPTWPLAPQPSRLESRNGLPPRVVHNVNLRIYK